MSENTPTIDEVRAAYIGEPAHWMDAKVGAEFDRFIRRIQAEARAEGFREGVNFIDNDPSLSWGGSMVAGRNEAARRMASIENVTDD